MDEGGLVGDDIMNGIVRDRLARDDVAEAGVLLDGYPRTADQADALEAVLDEGGHRLDVALNIDVPIGEVTARMLDRGRSDDTLEAIQRRLELYEEQTAPLRDWFEARGLLATVDGVGTPDEVFERVVAAVERSRERSRSGHGLEPLGWMAGRSQIALHFGLGPVLTRADRGSSRRRTDTAEAERGRDRIGGNRHGIPSQRNVPRRTREWPLRAGPHLGQDADALHPDTARGPRPSRGDAVRPPEGPYHLPLQVSINQP